MRIILPLLICLAGPAVAQDYGVLEGEFGSATDAATACGTNPHTMAIIDNRPHLARIWRQEMTGTAGSPRTREVYDVEGFDGVTFTLREEATYRADPSGTTGGMWEMRLTQEPAGYCWRRPDWPATQCEDQQLRCENPTS